VREKKRFENALDDSVASGLNAGTEVLMKEVNMFYGVTIVWSFLMEALQVEHIILTRTKPREYYPPEDAPLDLGPSKGCTDAIKCLEMHCKLLKGSTSREVLEVFYQEVGIRLIACVLAFRLIISFFFPFWLIVPLLRGLGSCKNTSSVRLFRLMGDFRLLRI
jgi:recyclin-1